MTEEADAFRALLPLLSVRPELQQLCRFGAQWASEHEPEPGGWAPFHIVTAGACMLEVRDRPGIVLSAGDVAFLPHGGPHTVRSVPSATGRGVSMRVDKRSHDELLVKSNIVGEPDAKLICGRLLFEHAHHNFVLAALPEVIVFGRGQGSDAARVTGIVSMMQSELEEDRLGAAPIAAALGSSLIIFVLRTHLEREHATTGILSLLMRRHTSRALAGMLAKPAHPWTLEELARRANTSRATLVRQFQTVVKMAPVAFLAELRLTLARSRIRATHMPLAVIAGEVGYQSETAFSRAYQRQFGIAPGSERKHTRL